MEQGKLEIVSKEVYSAHGDRLELGIHLLKTLFPCSPEKVVEWFCVELDGFEGSLNKLTEVKESSSSSDDEDLEYMQDDAEYILQSGQAEGEDEDLDKMTMEELKALIKDLRMKIKVGMVNNK